MNFAPIWIEDMSSIKNEIQSLKTTWRTGGNVANAYRFDGKGYNYNFRKDVLGTFFKSTTFGLTYFRQQSWSKNWIDVLGEMITGKDLIFVCNLYISVEENLMMLQKFKNQYKCNIVAVELGNENYLSLYRMSINEYLRRCIPFQVLFGDELNYKILYQISEMDGFKYREWNEKVSKVARYKALHLYPDKLVDPTNLIRENIEEHGEDIWITEWNLKEAALKYHIDDWAEWVFLFKKTCTDKKIINCFHNHLSPALGAWSDLETPREEIIKIFK